LSVKCSECPCNPQDCTKVLDAQQRCILCTKDVCCCASIHSRRYYPTVKKPLTLTDTRTALEPEDCYCSASVSCKNNNTVLNHIATSSQSSSSSSGLFQFLKKNIALFAAALGIEILYISAAEIGENTIAHTGILIVAALLRSRVLVQASCPTSGLRLGTLQLELQ